MKNLFKNKTMWIVILVIALIMSFALKSEAKEQPYL